MSILRKWYWRSLASMIAGCTVFSCILAGLEVYGGTMGGRSGGILAYLQYLIPIIGLIGIPSCGTSVLVYAWLKKRGEEPRDNETRCRKCGYILKGITEPRCSECGEPI